MLFRHRKRYRGVFLVELAVATMDRLIRKADATLRVSDSASIALAGILEEKSLAICRQAAEFARHAGRKTITDADIMLAAKQFK